jgi:hypothetical protein
MWESAALQVVENLGCSPFVESAAHGISLSFLQKEDQD